MTILEKCKRFTYQYNGKKPTLFEVDEVVKKITSEVDAEVEFIKGCIIDPSLEENLEYLLLQLH